MTTDRPFRIAHLTVYRDLPSGVRKQLKFEFGAAEVMPADIRWTTLAVHGGEAKEPLEKRIPIAFRAMFLRNLYGWITVWRLSREYDLVLLRHMVFDPFAFLFAPLIRNRVSVHHSKEIEELPLIRPGWTGRAAAWLERFSGCVVARTGVAVLGVTDDIARYESERGGLHKPHRAYPNGVDLGLVRLAQDDRDSGQINIVFMSDTFSDWHGLDRLIDAVDGADDDLLKVHIHIIGRLSNAQRAAIAELGEKASLFAVHGFLDQESYRTILNCADVGLGSLALDRQNMREGSTLKVRELLGAGLPVYANHRDAALPEDFPYFFNNGKVVLGDLIEFARTSKNFSRAEVRSAAAPFIEKSMLMQNLADWLRFVLVK